MLEIAAAFLGYALIGWLLALLYLALQWFVRATDISVNFDWSREGSRCHPNFEIRNRSRSRSYRLANIAYINSSDGLIWFDHQSIMGKELTPRSTHRFVEVSPVRNSSVISDCLRLQVALTLHTGRMLWLNSQRPSKPFTDWLRRTAFKLRNLVDRTLQS
jgi:hypothetical protein